jgi:hypothetical protein
LILDVNNNGGKGNTFFNEQWLMKNIFAFLAGIARKTAFHSSLFL